MKIRKNARALGALLLVGLCCRPGPPAAAAAAVPSGVIPVGQTVGVRIRTGGLFVTELSAVPTADGARSPAEEAGLRVGDRIVRAGAGPVDGAEDLQRAVAEAGGAPLALDVVRHGAAVTLTVRPARCAEDGQYRIGALTRDGLAGIGTMTFYDPQTGLFGALGHGITEAGGGDPLPLAAGCILDAAVRDVTKSTAGSPGELKGEFLSEESVGAVLSNTDHGVFGVLRDTALIGRRPAIPVAAPAQAHVGPARILSNVRGGEVEAFEIEIVKVYGSEGDGDGRHFMLKVTDPALLALTGGIVQGMSGSPVVQDGTLLGAVTHVLVSDPKRGYGIFAQTMLREGALCLAQTAA
ncbi:MAG: SpoIVB peptidase [Oscillospiraceae bacterium]|jgi:stage IV sporulation protein B|nr:SpoIVB peptidase [Oscillospiraceae bacterium]